jgi:hypothetical protein
VTAPNETAFDDLPQLGTTGLRHSWDIFTNGLGTMNRLSPEVTLGAFDLPRVGRTINLSLPQSLPDPPLFGRERLRHSMVKSSNRNLVNDRLDSFYPQGSTQWDALRHVRAREFGFFGGRLDEDDVSGDLGIHALAERGVIGRGVLADVATVRSSAGKPIDPFTDTTIGVSDVAGALDYAGINPRLGDVLCVRTGWVEKYRQLDSAQRIEYAQHSSEAPIWAGLDAGEDMARYLWNNGYSAVVVDNPTVEVTPGDPRIGSLHRRLIPCLGFYLGELFDFSLLAAECAVRQSWEFLFVSVPMNLVGATGSPGCAIAVI